MTISVRLNKADAELFAAYAKVKGITISDLVRQSVLERIEDEYDLQEYDRALAEYKANPQTHTLDEVERELGFL